MLYSRKEEEEIKGAPTASSARAVEWFDNLISLTSHVAEHHVSTAVLLVVPLLAKWKCLCHVL